MCCVQDKVDNLLQNYYAALESESCMDRWAALYLLYIYVHYLLYIYDIYSLYGVASVSVGAIKASEC